MSARDEFAPASADGICTEAVWGPMCDEIDRLRAELAEVEARCERMTIKANEATIAVAQLEDNRAGRKALPMIITAGVCAVDPEQDPMTCRSASLYRRQKGCTGEGCMLAASAYWSEYRRRRAQDNV